MAKKTDPTQKGTGDYDKKFLQSYKKSKKSTDEPMMEGTFGEAFAAARKAGKKTFTWGGKSYHTKTSEEVAEEKNKDLKKTHTKRKKVIWDSGRKNKWETWDKKRDGGFLEPGIENID